LSWLCGTFVATCLAAIVIAQPAPDSRFEPFWQAENVKAAAKAAGALLETGLAFDEAWQILRRGRRYPSDVRRGHTGEQDVAAGLQAGGPG
jgi:hypothetical protein